MYSKTEILDAITKANNWEYDNENDEIILEDGSRVSANVTVNYFREKIGQSFECIYSEHVSLYSVIQCTKCGTVIFNQDDEAYEHGLRCPTCTDYKTGFEYWTKENIDEDLEKKKAIEFYKKMAEEQRKSFERYKKRGNLHDFQKTHPKTFFKNKKWRADIQLTGFKKWDLVAEINIWKKSENGISSTCKHHIKIPLSPCSVWFYIKHHIKMKVTWKNV